MCGRFARYTPTAEFARLAGVTADAADAGDNTPRYNIVPSNGVLLIRHALEGGREQVALSWGLVPAWAREPIRHKPINARAETAAEKPFFRSAFRRQRCLIAADGFYEWGVGPDGKRPYFIRLADASPFFFGGLWDGATCAILTTTANARVRPIHERMPVIIAADDYATWLDPAITDATPLQPLLQSYPAERMEAYPVSRWVNNPANDDPDCIVSQTSAL